MTMRTILVCLLLVSSFAYGEGYTVKFSWGTPTARVDGSALDTSEIKGYLIKEDGIDILYASGTSNSAAIGNREYGSYHCYQIATEAYDVGLGPFSDEICKTLPDESKDFNVRPDSPLIIDFGGNL